MKLLYLPIEILDRELPSKLLIAIEAVSKGFAVCIIEQNELKANLQRLLPGAILHKDHADCNAYQIFKVLKPLGFTTCSLDEEGLVYFTKEHFARARIGQQCMNVTDLVFAWGNDQYQILKENIFNPHTAIAQTGNPRFDIHVANKEKRENHKPKKNILINTRFGSVNSGLELDVDGYIDRMRFVDEIKSEKDEAFRRVYFVFMQSLYNHFIDLISQLANSLPEYTFTVRPHPAESSSPYLDLAEKYRNVEVSLERSLEEDLLAHDLLIHNGCTTGIEAIVTNIPTIVYEPISAPEGDMALPNFFGKKAFTIDEVITFVQENQPVSFKNDIKKLSNYIDSLENGDAHKKIVEEVDKKLMVSHDYITIQNFKMKTNIVWKIKNLILKIPNMFLSAKLKQKKLQWTYVANKFPQMELKTMNDAIREIMSYKKYLQFSIQLADISCKKIGNKAFLLSKK